MHSTVTRREQRAAPVIAVVRSLMPNEIEPTPLESALLSEFHRLYGGNGFPDPSRISLLSRENTGAGRFVRLSSPAACISQEGYLDLGGKFIEMEGIPNGMMAVVAVSNGQPVELELGVYGNDGWDGKERAWVLK